jgi:DNA-3-methyladenine glycosylase
VVLPRSFYARDTLTVARQLLGKYLVFQPDGGVKMVGRIVETEAYRGPQDRACHAAWRRRESCAVLWGPPGLAYVYFTYGMYHLLNCVTEKDNFPAAVLIRALAPVEGIEKMLSNRAIKIDGSNFSNASNSSNARRWFALTSGPGKLTQALGISSKKHNGLDLTVGKVLWVEDHGENVAPRDSVAAPRIGVAYAGAWAKKPWRFYIRGNAFVSKK